MVMRATMILSRALRLGACAAAAALLALALQPRAACADCYTVSDDMALMTLESLTVDGVDTEPYGGYLEYSWELHADKLGYMVTANATGDGVVAREGYTRD